MHCQGTEVNHNGSISGTLALKFSGYVGVNVDDTYRGKPFLSLPERVICVKSIGLLHLGHSCALENRKRRAPIYSLHAHPVNSLPALGTFSIMQPIAYEPCTGTLNTHGPAGITIGALTGYTGQVAFVHIAKPLFHTDFTGTAQRGHRGRWPVHQFVSGIKSSNVPRHLMANAFHKTRNLPQFLLGII
jgi:hypothetical protein